MTLEHDTRLLRAGAAIALAVASCGGTTEAPPAAGGSGGTGAAGSGGAGGSAACTSAYWRPISPGPSPGRFRHSAVRGPDAIYVWGGMTSKPGRLDTGWKVSPDTGEVTPMSQEGAPRARDSFAATLSGDGKAMLIWGGIGDVELGEPPLSDGWRYDFALDQWTELAVPWQFAEHKATTSVRFGNHWLIWGEGYSNEQHWIAGRLYAFDTDTWEELPGVATWLDGCAPGGAPMHPLSKALLWCGEPDRPALVFDPNATDSFSPIEPSPEFNVERAAYGLVSSPETEEVVIWGGDADVGDGARRSVHGGGWIPLATENAPSPRTQQLTLMMGKRMVVLGGWDHGGGLADGAVYDLETDRWQPLPMECGPGRLAQPATITRWSESQALVWGSEYTFPDGGAMELEGERGWLLTLPPK